MNKPRQKLRKEVKRLQPATAPIAGIMGDFSGRILVSNRPNYVYVRVGNTLTEVFNDSVPPQYNLPVIIGKDARSPNQMRILSVRSDASASNQTPSALATPPHHLNHEWMATQGGTDVVYSQIRQLMPLRPAPVVTGQAVYVARNVSYLSNQWIGVTGQTIDLAPASPPTGSRFVLLAVDDDGLLLVTTGTVKNLMTLNLPDIPQPVPGTIPLAAVRLYPNQSRIQDAVSMQDIIDLRWNNLDTRVGLGTGSSIETDPVFLARAFNTSHYSGFPRPSPTTLSFVAGAGGATRTLTLGGTNFKIYINGTEYNIATSMTKQIADTTGIHWFWIELVAGVPTLQEQAGTSPGFDKCLVATVYWNTTIDLGLLGNERHWMGRDRYVHEYLHETIGTRYANGLAGTFGVSGTFSIGVGEYYDEDIEYLITGTQYSVNRIYKNTTADWQWDEGITSLPKISSNIPQYNSGNNLAPVGVNNYFAMWIFATNEQPYPIVAMLGQRNDNTLADARANNTPESISYGTLVSAEMKLLYRVIYQRNGAAPYADYIEAADYRATSSAPNSNYSATDHSTLSKLGFTESGHTGFEASLGNPATSGQVLVSTDAGVRSWAVVSGSSSGGGHTIEDEGSPLTQRSKLNFVGSNVVVTDDAGNDATNVTITPSTGSFSGHEVDWNGTPLTQRPKLNFVGNLVGVYDDGANDQTVVLVSGTVGGGAGMDILMGQVFG